jgi:hypothetical protein
VGEPAILVGADRRLRGLLTCPGCGAHDCAPAEFPSTLARWPDLPLPRGWRWAVAAIGVEGTGTGNVIVPLCPRCAGGRHVEPPGWRAGGDVTALPPVHVCPECLAVAPVVRPLPPIVASWLDVPLPEAWEWAASTARNPNGEAVGDVASPLCDRCVAAYTSKGEEGLSWRRCRARDLTEITDPETGAAVPLGGPRGLPVGE